MRMMEIQNNVLNSLTSFTIWNAGRQGKKFFRSLTPETKRKLLPCVIKVTARLPIISYRDCKPPVIICIKVDMTEGVFEQLLAQNLFPAISSPCNECDQQHDEDNYFRFALDIVNKAGRLVKDAFAQPNSHVTTKASATDLVTETDQAVEEMLIKGLSAQFPTHKFIGEEIPLIAICVGLAINKKLRAGIVYNPITNELFTAQAGKGALKNGFPIHVSSTEALNKSPSTTRRKLLRQESEAIEPLARLPSTWLWLAFLGHCCCSSDFERAGGFIIDPTGSEFNVLNRKFSVPPLRSWPANLVVCLLMLTSNLKARIGKARITAIF
uniref:Uncharacterized protein n=1 Tax=Ditylenchus dipsaci TaxID=166011 RepID=A0A915E2A3_9BILA